MTILVKSKILAAVLGVSISYAILIIGLVHYTPCPGKEATVGLFFLGITLTTLDSDTVSYFLAEIILILLPTKTLEKLAQHCNIVTWRSDVIKNAVYMQTKTDI